MMPNDFQVPATDTRDGKSTRDATQTVLAFVNDAETEETVQKCLLEIGTPNGRVMRGTLTDATNEVQAQHSPQILIVDVAGVAEPLDQLYRLADVCDPSTSVVVIGDRSDIPFYRSLREIGVAEYFFKPVVLEHLAHCCETLVADGVSASRPRLGKVVTVLGVRGGVGATTIAVNAAWHVSEELQRSAILIDLDLNAGDAALQLDLKPSHALFECLEHPDRIDELFLERAVVHSAPRLGLLASLEPLEQPVVPQDQAAVQVLSSLRSHYRYVVVDMRSAIAAQMKNSVQAPGIVLLVSDGTLSSAREVGRWRRHLGPDRVNRRVLHVLNMAHSDRDLPYDHFVKAIGHEPDLVIPYDAAIARATNLGTPALNKSTTLSAKMTDLFRHIVGDVPSHHPQSLVSRLFRA